MTPALQLTHGAARHWECTCNRIHQTCCFLCWRHRKGNNHSQMGKWCGVQRPISDDMVVCQYPHLLCLCLGPSRERKSKDNVHQQPARAEHQGEEEAGEEKKIWHAACGGVHANPAPYHQVEAHVVHPAKQHHVALGECLHHEPVTSAKPDVSDCSVPRSNCVTGLYPPSSGHPEIEMPPG